VKDMKLKRYEATRQTTGAYRELSPAVLEYALYVDPDSCVYPDGGAPEEVIAACPNVSDITEQELAVLRGDD
jgi:hypothetical protein